MKRRFLACLRQINMSFRNSLYKLAILIAQSLPLWFGYFLADFAGDISFLSSPKRRKIVMGNLKRVLGERAENHTLRNTTRQVFRNVGRNYLDLTRVSKINSNRQDRKTTIEGWQHLVRAQSNKKGVILATAHLGNFELGTQILVNRGVELTILVEEFASDPILQQIAKLRQRKGVRILPVTLQGMKEVFYNLIRGGTVIIVSDRDIQGNGIKIKFMGEDTTLPSGAVSLAQRTGAALIPIFSLRTPHNGASIYIESPVYLINNNNREESLRANVEKLAAIFEKYIRQYPEQWAIMEPFWQRDKVPGI
jgi:phosphatidylinositol dimannoside acyltransferase